MPTNKSVQYFQSIIMFIFRQGSSENASELLFYHKRHFPQCSFNLYSYPTEIPFQYRENTAVLAGTVTDPKQSDLNPSSSSSEKELQCTTSETPLLRSVFLLLLVKRQQILQPILLEEVSLENNP